MKRTQINVIIGISLVLLAAAARVVNSSMHLYNFVPLAAIGLFSGAVIKDKRFCYLIPLIGQLLGDVYFQLFTNIPGFYDFTQLFTYGGLAAATGLGVLMNRVKPVNVLAYTFGASTLFFLISNFGVWLGGMYGYSFSGLLTTYFMGIPFFKYTVVGDMAGSVLLFGGYFLIQQMLAGKMHKAKA